MAVACPDVIAGGPDRDGPRPLRADEGLDDLSPSLRQDVLDQAQDRPYDAVDLADLAGHLELTDV